MQTRSILLVAALAAGSVLGAGASPSPAGPATDAVTRPVMPVAYVTKHHHHDHGDDGDGRKHQANALRYLHEDLGSDYDFHADYPTGPNPLASPPPPIVASPPPAQAPAPGQ